MAKNDRRTKIMYNKILKIKKFVWPFIFYITSTSLSALLICSFIMKQSVYVQDMSQWAGLILGIVASITSLISLYIGFYSLEKGEDINKDTTQALNRILQLTINTNNQVSSALTNTTYIDNELKENTSQEKTNVLNQLQKIKGEDS